MCSLTLSGCVSFDLSHPVAPLSVLSNWEKQIEEHCTRGALSSCVYYGAKRSMTAAELTSYDVVITTYQTVAGEHSDSETAKGEEPAKKKKKLRGTLFEVQWKVDTLCVAPSLELFL